MKMRSHCAACKSAALADAVDQCGVGVKLRQFLKSLFSSTPKFIDHMAIVKLNFYMLDANYVRPCCQFEDFQRILQSESCFWFFLPPTL